MTGEQYSIFDKLPADAPVAFWNGDLISREQFWSHVSLIAESLPDHQYAINLCEDRYMFLATFVACLLRNQTSLLPPNRAPKEIERLGKNYPDNYRIVDKSSDQVYANEYIAQLTDGEAADWSRKELDCELVAAVVFTSGSTGRPKPNPKRWKDLVTSSLKVKQQLGFGGAGTDSIVATVPPQHMFGFELSIIYPLVNGACVHGGKPFFPHDIKMALNEVPAPRVLVTTPLHLHACSESGLDWPKIDSVVSATAPLREEVARLSEKEMQTKVLEIYGCSEIGAIATRCRTKESSWRLLDGYHLSKKQERFWLELPGRTAEIELPDQVNIESDERFTLVGRQSDIINIGGKRGSLADLTIKLKSLNGVKDGIFFIPDLAEDKRVRLAALVVTRDLDTKDVLDQLAEHIERVFLPRPILKVDHLPYSESGKLPRAALMTMLKRSKQFHLLLETA